MQLSDYVDISAGYSFRERIIDDPAGDALVLQAGDLDGTGGINWAGAHKVRLPRRGRANWLQEGDVLIASKGARNTLAVVDAPPGDAICASNLFVIRPDQTRLLPAYLAAFMRAGPGRAFLEQAAEGSKVAHLRKSALAAMPLNPPPIERQRELLTLEEAIDAELAVLDRLRENRAQTLSALLGEGLEAQEVAHG
ncbi:hypothetical protein J2T57_001584 [Natronocella acetinitrilica]|uniref:Restriction endonuclease subunit S n=1 Tax=Natronocella acetinitrilica TaxID=414046 RepID=A0AAE3KFV0_9GAMM|nr:hypothetical protein [Natronocella acetinitrilica]MCP1674482.1 hypothetical protein [Natronocella acetinitrilica]